MTDAPTPPTPPTPPAPPAGDPAPQQAQRPEWLPEAHWDSEGGAIKPEFGAHYAELSAFRQTASEREAALKARKPEDIKLELKLPDTVKVPDGMEIKIDDKDPRIPMLRQVALERGLDQETVNAFVALDAQQKIAAHNAEVERIAAEDAKLGEKVGERKAAVGAWVDGLLASNTITKDEHQELRLTATSAAGVTVLEKIMAKAAGNVPGHVPPTPPKPAPQSQEQRWYGTGSQQKVS